MRGDGVDARDGSVIVVAEGSEVNVRFGDSGGRTEVWGFGREDRGLERDLGLKWEGVISLLIFETPFA
jgi:hypothetical protein